MKKFKKGISVTGKKSKKQKKKQKYTAQDSRYGSQGDLQPAQSARVAETEVSSKHCEGKDRPTLQAGPEKSDSKESSDWMSEAMAAASSVAAAAEGETDKIETIAEQPTINTVGKETDNSPKKRQKSKRKSIMSWISAKNKKKKKKKSGAAEIAQSGDRNVSRKSKYLEVRETKTIAEEREAQQETGKISLQRGQTSPPSAVGYTRNRCDSADVVNLYQESINPLLQEPNFDSEKLRSGHENGDRCRTEIGNPLLPETQEVCPVGEHEVGSSHKKQRKRKKKFFKTEKKSKTAQIPQSEERKADVNVLQHEVQEIKDIMKENINQIVERGEKLEDLRNRAEDLDEESTVFNVKATRTREKYNGRCYNCYCRRKWRQRRQNRQLEEKQSRRKQRDKEAVE